MEKSPNNINNKIKQAISGNWGKPNKVEQEVILPKNLFIEEVKYKSKKKKRERKPYICWYHVCPFCGNELEDDTELLKSDPNVQWTIGIFQLKKHDCKICGSYEINNGCPACKHNIWYNPNTKIYKHQSKLGCGFEGEKKNE